MFLVTACSGDEDFDVNVASKKEDPELLTRARAAYSVEVKPPANVKPAGAAAKPPAASSAFGKVCFCSGARFTCYLFLLSGEAPSRGQKRGHSAHQGGGRRKKFHGNGTSAGYSKWSNKSWDKKW